MSLKWVQKPTKMSFRVEDLAISSRATSSEQPFANVYRLNWYQTNIQSTDLNTPEKINRFSPLATSTPLSSDTPFDDAHIERQSRQPKRKRDDDSVSLDMNNTGSSDSTTDSYSTTNSDDDTEGPRKKARCMFTSIQVKELEKCYNINKYLPIEERPVVAERLKLSQQQVKTWFQNRRMKAKRQKKNSPIKYIQIDVTGGQYPSYHMTGFNTLHFPGYQFNYLPQNKAATQIFDSNSFIFTNSPLSFNHHGYNTQMYDGLSPKTSDQCRQ